MFCFSYFDASRTLLDKEKLPFSPNEHYGDAEHRETKSERSRRRYVIFRVLSKYVRIFV